MDIDKARSIADLIASIDTLDAYKILLTEIAAEPCELPCMLSVEVVFYDGVSSAPDKVSVMGNGNSINYRVAKAMIQAAIVQMATIQAELATELSAL